MQHLELEIVVAATAELFQKLPMSPELASEMPAAMSESDLFQDDFDLDGYPDLAFRYTSGRHVWSAMAWLYNARSGRFELSDRLLECLRDITGYEVNAKAAELETVVETPDSGFSSWYAAKRGFQLLESHVAHLDPARRAWVETRYDYRGPVMVERHSISPADAGDI
jgi:hypothetical protein